MPPDEGGVYGRRRKDVVNVLRQQCEMFRELLAPVAADGFAEKSNATGPCGSQPCQRVE